MSHTLVRDLHELFNRLDEELEASVLLSGIFAVSALYGMQALSIESNTQRIALSKARIASSLEKLRLD